MRAESLFRRFQRTVETVDAKKSGLGSPSKGKGVTRRPTSGGASGSANTVATGSGGRVVDEGPEISDDLRKLLSKKIVSAK